MLLDIHVRVCLTLGRMEWEVGGVRFDLFMQISNATSDFGKLLLPMNGVGTWHWCDSRWKNVRKNRKPSVGWFGAGFAGNRQSIVAPEPTPIVDSLIVVTIIIMRSSGTSWAKWLKWVILQNLNIFSVLLRLIIF